MPNLPMDEGKDSAPKRTYILLQRGGVTSVRQHSIGIDEGINARGSPELAAIYEQDLASRWGFQYLTRAAEHLVGSRVVGSM